VVGGDPVQLRQDLRRDSISYPAARF